jgi:hypothetical protein
MIEIQKQVLVVQMVVVKKHVIHNEQPMTRRDQPGDRLVEEA